MPHALLALNAGKHVLVEKAFTINAREAQDIVELAEAKGLVALEAMWTRFLPHMVRLREIIREGTIGEVRKVIASHNQDLPKDPAHRLNDPALGGGALLDLGIYPVSFAFGRLDRHRTHLVQPHTLHRLRHLGQRRGTVRPAREEQGHAVPGSRAGAARQRRAHRRHRAAAG